MAGRCTHGQYFYLPSARKVLLPYSCNIQPYSTLTRAIICIHHTRYTLIGGRGHESGT